jgi:glutaredoxin
MGKAVVGKSVVFIIIGLCIGISALPSISADVGKNNVLNENPPHSVLAEFASLTTCPHCPKAASQLYSVYNSSDYDFHYVTIVADKITELPSLAQLRLDNRLKELGVKSVPDVYFDGGYKRLLGEQKDEVPYRNAIEQTGTRDAPEISIDLKVNWKGVNTIEITTQIQTNDSEFKGYVRIYVTEIESHWLDLQGKKFHYAVLDMPVNKSLNAVTQLTTFNQQILSRTLDTTYTVTKSWSGNITKDNCMVIASVFDKDTGYVVQTASTRPVSASCNDLSYNLNRSIVSIQFLQHFIQAHPSLFPLLQKIIHRLGLQE